MKIRKVVVTTGAIAVVSGYLIGRLHHILDANVSPPPAKDSMADNPAPESNNHGQRVPDQTGTALRWRLALLLVVASGVLSGIAAEAAHPNHVLAEVALLVALALSSFVIRGPRKRTSTEIFVTALILVIVQGLAIAAITLIGITSSDPKRLLELTTVAIIGLGIVIFLIVTWLPGWPYAEPSATAIIAIFLGLLCVPGLSQITKSLQYPDINGQVMLFATGSRTPDLSLGVTVDTVVGPPTSESFFITTVGAKPIHWALLLVGDARIDSNQESQNAKWRAIRLKTPSESTPAYVQAQLFWGSVGKSPSYSMISGRSHATFVDKTGDLRAIQLPFYTSGTLSLVNDADAKKLIVTALGGEPTAPYSSISITGDYLGQFDSIERADPAPQKSSESPPGPISWENYKYIEPSYVVKNESATGKITNFSFVFALLLGAAGAALLASLQSMIHILSRKAQATKDL